MFDLLKFESHEVTDGIHATYKFENDWKISVVSGRGLYGLIEDETYEVAIFRPNGNMTEDVSGWNTKDQVSAMMWVLSQL